MSRWNNELKAIFLREKLSPESKAALLKAREIIIDEILENMELVKPLCDTPPTISQQLILQEWSTYKRLIKNSLQS